MNPTYKTYSFKVATRNQQISPEFDLDKNIKEINALAFDSTKRGTLFTYGSQRVEIGGVEVFPEGHRTNMLMFGITAADKMHRFKTPLLPGSGKLRLFFLDTWVSPDPGQPDDWTPYTVYVTIEQQAVR